MTTTVKNGHGSTVGETSGCENSGHADGRVDSFGEQWFGTNVG